MRAAKRGEADRPRDVAPSPEHRVGSPLAQDPRRGADRRPGPQQRTRSAQRVRPAQALDADRAQRVAGGGHELRLRALAADELTSAPAAVSRSATASAGTTCPAVPPAAMITLDTT